MNDHHDGPRDDSCETLIYLLFLGPVLLLLSHEYSLHGLFGLLGG